MGNSGVGMFWGDVSVTALWLWFIGAFILGAAILYGVLRAGRLRRSERAQLDRNTEAAQRSDDPQKRAAAENKSRPF
jgi:Flp pilus assembly protein TadB